MQISKKDLPREPACPNGRYWNSRSYPACNEKADPRYEVRGRPVDDREVTDRLRDAGYNSVEAYERHLSSSGRSPFGWFKNWKQGKHTV